MPLDRNAILKRMNNALAELHRCHAELGALEASAPATVAIERPLDVLAQELSQFHPAHKTASVAAAGNALYQLLSKSLEPSKDMGHIRIHHAWRCKFDWPTRPPQMVPYLQTWIKEFALDPIPGEEEGMKLLEYRNNPGNGAVKLSKREQEAAALQKEMGW